MNTKAMFGIAALCVAAVVGLIVMDQRSTAPRDPATAQSPPAGTSGKSGEVSVPSTEAALPRGTAEEPERSGQKAKPSAVVRSEPSQEPQGGKPLLPPKNPSPQAPAIDKSGNPAMVQALPPSAKKDPLDASSGQKTYTVQQGDTLYGISIKIYHTPRHYEKIYEANKDRIRDPNTLQIGINLKMPDLPSQPAPADVSATRPKENAEESAGAGSQAPR